MVSISSSAVKQKNLRNAGSFPEGARGTAAPVLRPSGVALGPRIEPLPTHPFRGSFFEARPTVTSRLRHFVGNRVHPLSPASAARGTREESVRVG
jgi:hypothetical protein